MKFFKPEDFYGITSFNIFKNAADIANAKLERECTVIYKGMSFWSTNSDELTVTQKAILLNIEPIKKETAVDVLRSALPWLRGACSPYNPLLKRVEDILEGEDD